MSLTEDLITFGKYKDFSLSRLLKDRQYCVWLLKQEWFLNQYQYLYNRIKDYNPLSYFITHPILEKYSSNFHEFINTYPFFHLKPLDELKIPLDETEKKCYQFYRQTIDDLKLKMEAIQGFDIKAPTKWLKQLETNVGINRDAFKEFLTSYDLPNIPTIIEHIKQTGGLVYNGAKSYLIAKTKSVNQENHWQTILKQKYGEDLGTQYKFGNCIFDYVVIKQKTIFECKLGLKDFNEKQYNKYMQATDFFKIIYLIDTDCVVHIPSRTIYTTDKDKYILYLQTVKTPNKFILLIQNFAIEQVSNLENFL